MLKYILYPLFGFGVIGAYTLSAVSATDPTSVPTTRRSVPAEYRSAGALGAAPIIWRTGFHGPAAYSARRTSGSSGGGGYYGGGGFYGGFGGGK